MTAELDRFYGWLVRQIGQWYLRRWLREQRPKFVAAGVVAAVIVAGLAAAAADDD